MHFDTHSTPSNKSKCHDIEITQGRSRHKEAIPNIDIMSSTLFDFSKHEDIGQCEPKFFAHMCS